MKMKTRLLFLGIAVAAIALAQPLGAANDIKNVTMTAVVSATAKLELSSLTVAFPDTPDPDANPLITASGVLTITAKGKTSGGAAITLTVSASDLSSPTDTIAISNVTWASTGAGFAPTGTLSNAAQTMASWTNSGSHSGTQTYTLANSWSYAVGNYTGTAVYTLTTP
jgi:hypothetical protein